VCDRIGCSHHLVVRHVPAKSQHAGSIRGCVSYLVQTGNARYVHQDVLMAHASLQLEDQVRAARDQTTGIAVPAQQIERLTDRGRRVIGPHMHLR